MNITAKEILLNNLSSDDAKKLLKSLGLNAALKSLHYELSVQYALSQLQAGLSRKNIRKKLEARYHLSRSTAYRVINRALSQRKPVLEPLTREN
jgi:signal transduction histidine kinase